MESIFKRRLLVLYPCITCRRKLAELPNEECPLCFSESLLAFAGIDPHSAEIANSQTIGRTDRPVR